ncbi:hypothetical protein KC368_g77 [Hortaea werneckii]|nr:hypothetical protein KC368_g77 [Hortaea werneckii]
MRRGVIGRRGFGFLSSISNIGGGAVIIHKQSGRRELGRGWSASVVYRACRVSEWVLCSLVMLFSGLAKRPPERTLGFASRKRVPHCSLSIPLNTPSRPALFATPTFSTSTELLTWTKTRRHGVGFAHQRPTLTRSHSTDSSSALSNIDVSAALQAAAAASDDSSVQGDNDDDEDDDRDALEPEASTPPTSLAESGGSQGRGSGVKMGKMERVEEHVEAESSGRKSRRARASGVRTYNLKELSDAQQPLPPSTADASQAGNARQRIGSSAAMASRNVSGLTGKTLARKGVGDGVGTPWGR